MKWTTTLLLTCVALILVGWIVFVELPADREPELVELPAKAIFVPEPADIVRMEIAPRGRPHRAFVKDGEEWEMVEPIEAAVTKWAVDSDCNRLQGLQYVQAYPAGAEDRPSDVVTGLSEPAFVLRFTDSAGEEFGLKIGNRRPIGEGTYVQRPGDEVVYLVKEDLGKGFDRKLEEYRDRTVVRADAIDAVELAVRGLHSYTLRRDEDQWLLAEPIRARADKDKVQDVVNTLARLYATSFVPVVTTNLAAYGLDPPRLTLTLTTEKTIEQPPTEPATEPATVEPAEPIVTTETHTYTVLIGGKTEANYYAKLADQPSIFEINAGTYNRLAKGLDDVRDPAVLPFNRHSVIKLIIDSLADGVTILTKGDDGTWAIEGLPFSAETTAVQQALQALAGLQSTGYEDPQSVLLADLGFDPPRCRVTLTIEGQVGSTVLEIGKDTPSGTMTYVRNLSEEVISVVPVESVQALPTEPLAFFDRSIVEIDRPRVEQIEVIRDGRTVRLEKTAGAWKMLDPVVADVETSAVNELLADVTRLRAARVVAHADQAAEFGLDNPAVSVEFVAAAPLAAVVPTTQPGEEEPATQSAEPATRPAVESPPAEPTVTRLLAAERNGQAFVMLPGGSLIYVIDPQVYEHLAAEFHQRRLMQLTPEQVVSVRLSSPGNAYEFRRTDKEWSLADDPFFPVDQAKVNDMVGAIRDLQAQRFLAYSAADLSAFGLDRPSTILTVALSDGTKLQLDLTTSDEPQTLHGTIADSGEVFSLARADLDPVDQPIGYFKKSP